MMTAAGHSTNLLYGLPFRREAVMPDAGVIMRSLLEALPEEAEARDELVALGAVAAGVINTTEVEGRAALVERFCATLRKNVATELN